MTDNQQQDSFSFYRGVAAARGLLAMAMDKKNAMAMVPAVANPFPAPNLDADHRITLGEQDTVAIALTARHMAPQTISFSLAEKPKHQFFLVNIFLPTQSHGRFFWQIDGRASHSQLPLYIRVNYYLQQGAALDQVGWVGANGVLRFEQNIFLQAPGAVARLFTAAKTSVSQLATTESTAAAPNSKQADGRKMVAADNFIDCTTRVWHQAGDSQSRLVLRAAVDAGERMIGQVDTDIAVNAKGADTAQDIKAMLLHSSSKFDGKPQLNIGHDQVKAKHGLSVGAIDPEQLYYLRARALGEVEARQLLLTSFFLNGLNHLAADFLPIARSWLQPFISNNQE